MKPPSLPVPTDRTLRDLDLGCRVGLLVLTAILAYFAVRLSWLFYSESVARMFDAMLKGQPQPLSLRVAEAGKGGWMMLSCGMPILAISVAAAVRRPLTALLAISACNLGLAIIIALLGTGIIAGFGRIVVSLS